MCSVEVIHGFDMRVLQALGTDAELVPVDFFHRYAGKDSVELGLLIGGKGRDNLLGSSVSLSCRALKRGEQGFSPANEFSRFTV